MAWLLEMFFKFHYLASHFMCGLVVLIGLVALSSEIDKVRKRKLIRLGCGLVAGLALFLCATGLGLALKNNLLSTTNYIHGFLGVVTFFVALFFYSYPEKKHFKHALKIILPLSSFAVIAGVLSSAGIGYFTSPELIFKPQEKAPAPFAIEVSTIIDKKCLKCHNSSVHAGNLDLKNIQEVMEIRFPHEPFDSKIYQRVNASFLSEKHMPLHEGNLSPEEISVILKWINEGANTSALNRFAKRDIAQVPAEATDSRLKSWSFQKFAKPQVPKVKHPQWVKNEIDQFIVHSLEKVDSFEMSPLKSEILSRRLALVLTGLPPAISERTSSFDELKRRYLDSIGFAENFGLYWMDLTAFGDDDGFEPTKLDRPRNSSVYKKRLLEVLKQQPSYFAILREQLAPIRSTSGVNNHSLLNFIPHDDYPDLTVDSAMATTFSMTLGIDMRCARCHDHPNEPITNENYYQLAAGFQNEFKVNDPINYRYRQALGDLPRPAIFNIFEASRKPPHFDEFSNLAPWLTDAENGVGLFTARVFVDQVWQFVFGKSLMTEAGQFGASSLKPHYVDLLNWLAWDFLEHDTSIKYLIDKMISSEVFSHQMKLSAKYDGDVYQVYRHRLLRTENIRDNLLAAAGNLSRSDWQTPLPDKAPSIYDWKDSREGGLPRSIYLYRTRNSHNDANEYVLHFGLSKRYVSSTRQEIPQGINVGLFLLNDSYFKRLVTTLKTQLPKAETFSREFINDVYRKVLSRDAENPEIAIWQKRFAGSQVSENELGIMFRVLISGNEFLYIP